jgi:hypothetical protein
VWGFNKCQHVEISKERRRLATMVRVIVEKKTEGRRRGW